MNTSLSHLPEVMRKQLTDITRICVTSVRPEKLFLFGTYASPNLNPLFAPGNAIHPQISCFDILVIMRPNHQRKDYEIQDLIENRSKPKHPVNILVHDIDYINQQLSHGQPFMADIIREGILLFDSGKYPLAEPAAPDLARLLQTSRQDFQRWHHQARAFYDSAIYNLHKEELTTAAFLLHQAVEQAYQSVLLTFTGYKPCTHNLDKLRRITTRFSIELAALFPRHTEEEDRLFKFLCDAYVEARYHNMPISENYLNELTERIRLLLDIAERICHNRFRSLEKQLFAAA